MCGEWGRRHVAGACFMLASAIFLASCVVGLKSLVEIDQFLSCVEAGMEWRDGDCLRPEVRQ